MDKPRIELPTEKPRVKETCDETHKILQLIPISERTYCRVSCVDEKTNKPSTYEAEVFALALVQTSLKYSHETVTERYNGVLPVTMYDEGQLDIEPRFEGDFYHVKRQD